MKVTDDMLRELLLDCLEGSGLQVPEPKDIWLYAPDMTEGPEPADIDEFDGIHIGPEDQEELTIERVASWIHRELRDLERTPGRWSWRRWNWVGRLSSFLYVAGVTNSGGSYSRWGRDPFGTVHTPPSLRSFKPGPRTYLFGVHQWKRRCYRAQGFRLRGRHRPGPNVYSCCGTCMPWYCCGATGVDHDPSCKEFT